MCEVWLKRKGIDPMINTSKNYHKLQDEFFKVLAHINRGFELEVNADWKSGVGKLIEHWKRLDEQGDPQWIDHKKERIKGDPVSRYELKEEPKQDVADAFWVNLFKKGRKWGKNALRVAEEIDGQQSRFFVSSFEIDEQKTFTETKINLLNHTQEEWLNARLSSLLGVKKGRDFLEETFASSLRMLKVANKIIMEGNAKLWIIKNFFQLARRDWNYLLETLTGGHIALERLFGSLIATLILGHDRKLFELKEDDAEELFRIFLENGFRLSFQKSENVLRSLHQALINSEDYEIYLDAATVLSALQIPGSNGRRYKSYYEATTVLRSLDNSVKKVVQYNIHETEADLAGLQYPINNERSYAQLISKLQLLLKLEMEIHKVIEDVFWNVTGTFSDLIKAYKIQQNKEASEEEKEELKKIAKNYHLRMDEKNFLMYAPDRCYIGKEISYFREPEEESYQTSVELYFEKKTQKVKRNYLTPPLYIRRELTILCGRYGKLIGDVYDQKGKKNFRDVKMIWNSSKIQITDLRYKPAIKPQTHYEIKITRAEPRKLREKWE